MKLGFTFLLCAVVFAQAPEVLQLTGQESQALKSAKKRFRQAQDEYTEASAALANIQSGILWNHQLDSDARSGADIVLSGDGKYLIKTYNKWSGWYWGK